MSESNAPTAPATPEPALFSALLTPHRSLSGTGFFIVMGLMATACAGLYWRFRRVGWL